MTPKVCSRPLAAAAPLQAAAVAVVGFVVALAALLVAPGHALALVSGDPMTLYQQFRLHGDASVAGNTLMIDTCPSVNTVLLTESGGDIGGIPADAEIEGAFLFWSASDNTVDNTATLVTPGGAIQSFTASGCHSVSHLGGSYACKSDVTAFVANNPAPGGSFNGTYTVRGVTGDVGLVDANCGCLDTFCQAKYAGWSLILVYSSPTETTERDVFVYDGFRVIDEELNTAGVDTFNISGFNVGSPPEANLSFFALEGDRQLGIPPQDLAPGSAGCPDGSCIDSLAFNGTRLSNSTNPPGNVFNGTVPGGFAIGVDLDSYNVSSLVTTGDTSAQVRLISGDGTANNNNNQLHGWGEYVIVNWLLLRINRLAPNFGTNGTFLDAVPTQVAPGGSVFYTLQVTNDGSLAATNVVVRDVLPPELEYVPGTTRVDGVLVTDVGGNSALASGLSLGTLPHTGDNDRRITVEVRVRTSVLPGTIIVDDATIDATEVDPPVVTNSIQIEVIGPQIARPTKIDKDLNGGEPRPDDIVEYEVFVSKQGNTSVGGLTFTDDISPFVQLIELPSGAFDASNSSLTGGANGTGRIDVRDISIPANQTGVFIRYKVRILSTAELIAKGVDPADINGLAVVNQGFVAAPFLPQALATDDPAAAGQTNPTRFEIRTGVDFAGANTRKTAVDVNGGRLVPGDTVEFTLRFENRGAETGTISVVDDIRPFLQNVTVTTPRPEVAFAAAPAGAFANGRLTISNLQVAAGTTVEVRFTAVVAASAPDGSLVENVAALSVQQDPGQNRDLPSTPLVVFNRPLFDDTTKTVLNQTTGGGPDFQPGDVVRYTIATVNSGTVAATAVTVTDVVDPNLTAVTPEDGGSFDAATRTITWNLGDVAVGATVTLHFTATIALATPNGTTISNQATVDGANSEAFASDDPATGPADDPTRFTVEALPDLTSLAKTFTDEDGAPTEPGDSILYTVSVTNSGRAVATNTVITDAIPAAFEPASVQPLDGGVVAGDTVTWNVGTVTVGQTVTVRVRATLRAVLPAGSTVSNQAFADAAELTAPLPSDDPATPAVDDPTSFPVTSEADLATSTKTVADLNGGAFQPGDTVEYTLVFENTGNAPATGVVVRDVVDANLTAVQPLDGGSFDTATRTITWNLAQILDPGAPVTLRFRATIDAATPDGAVIANQGSATGTGITGTALTNDPTTPAPADPTRFTVVRQPDFVESTKAVLELDGNGEFRPGDRVRYTLSIVNSGTTAATNVVVTDAIPANLVNVAVSGGAVAGGTITWTLPTLAAGATASLSFEADLVNPLADGTIIENQAFVASDEIATAVPTDDPATPAVDDPTAFTVISRPDLEDAQKTFVDVDGGNVEPGDTIEYTITFSNAGTDTARATLVTDTVDANLASVVPQDGGVFDAVSRVITWPVGDLGPGEARTLRFTAQVASPLANLTRIDNQASVFAQGLAAPVLSDDPATVQPDDPTSFFVVSAADLTGATKSASAPGAGGYRPGDTVTWTLSATNTGTDAATGVVVRDTLDPNLTGAVALDGGSVAGNTVTWNVGSVAVGQTVTVRFTATIASPLPDGTAIANQGFFTSPDFGSDVPTDDPGTPATDDPTVITVTSAPRFSASTKTALDLDGDGFFDVGDRVRYELVVVNDGDAPATDVVVTDPVDTTRLLNLAIQNGGVLSGSTITWTIPALAAGSQTTVAFEADIVSTLANGTPIANQAQLTDASGQSAVTDDPATPADDDATVIIARAEARLSESTKSVVDLNGGDLEPGDTLRYTLTILSSGTQAASGVRVIDDLDPSLTSVTVNDARATVGPTQIIWDLGDLPAGSVETLTFDAVVVPGAPDGTVISNQGIVIADGPISELTDDPATPAVDDPTLIGVNAAPQLSASTKVVVPVVPGPFLRPGDVVEYTITVQNDGLAAADNVVVSDTVPATLTDLTPIGGPAQVTGNTIRWDGSQRAELASLARGSFVNLVFRATVAEGVASGTLIANQAQITAEGGVSELTDDPGTPAVDDPTVLEVRFPQLASFVKTVEDLDGGEVEAGDLLRYTLTLTNGPSAAATGLLAFDAVPETLLIEQAFQGGEILEQGRLVRWNPGTTPELASVSPGGVVVLQFDARVGGDVANGTVIANQAQVGGDAVGPLLSDDPNTFVPGDATVVIVGGGGGGADFGLSTKTSFLPAGGTLRPLDTIEYTLTLLNSGSSASSAALLFDAVPMSTRYLAGSTRLNGVGVPDAPGGQSPLVGGLLVNAPGEPPGVVSPGGFVEVTFSVQVLDGTPEGTLIVNQGRVRGDDGTEVLTDDPNTAPVDDPTINVVGDSAALLADKVDVNGGQVGAGEVISYMITVRNVGNRSSEGFLVRDAVPANTEYIRETIHVDGRQQTDADDGDAGRLVPGAIEVGLPPLAPGLSTTITFDVRAAGPPFDGVAVNQARLQQPDGTLIRVSDDPRLPGPEDPTLTVIGDGGDSPLVLRKDRPLPLDGGTSIELGDAVRYSVHVTNTSDREVSGVTLIDSMPSDLIDVGTESVPEPATVTVAGNTVTIGNLRVPARATVTLGLIGTVAGPEQGGTAALGKEFCNSASARVAGGLPFESNAACEIPSNIASGMSQLTGVVVHDLGTQGVLEPDDRPLDGYTIEVIPAASPTADPIARTESAEDGTWSVMVPVGRYFIRQYTERGVQMGRTPQDGSVLEAVEQASQIVPVLIDPQGIVYDSQSGEPLSGIQLFVFYDEQDPIAPGELVGPDDCSECANQQGQLTSADGFYRFDLPGGRAYRLEANLTNSQTFQYPSLLTPPQAGLLEVRGADPIFVVPNELPDLDSEQRYFLRFAIFSVDPVTGEPTHPEGAQNNHLPLDPIESLISLDKRVDKRAAQVGDVLTYKVTVQNRSERDIVFDVTNDPTDAFNGVWIQDEFPGGGTLRFVPGTARAQVFDGSGSAESIEVALDEAGTTTGASIHRFGRRFGNQVVGMDLPAGGRVELLYRAVVGIRAEPHRTYTNVATLYGTGNVALSRSDSADVRVEPDPIFDQGEILGKVFCDADADGFQDVGEQGVFHARIYLDTGYFVTTDVYGKYHFHDVDAGSHQIKIDTGTLPPGSGLTTAESRIFYMTRGLPVKVNWGVACAASELVEAGDVVVGGDAAAAAEEAFRANYVEVAGDLDRWTVRVAESGFDLMLPIAVLSLDEAAPAAATEVAPQTIALEGGALSNRLVFNLRQAQGPAPSRWKLSITEHQSGALVRSFEGNGLPPATLEWDGTDLSGQTLVLAPSTVYLYQLDFIGDDDDFGRSAPGLLLVQGASREVLDEVVLDALEGELFGADDQPTRRLRAALEESRAIFESVPPGAELVVEVHTDDELVPFEAFDLTSRQADALAATLVELGLVPEGVAVAVGRGSDEPFLPNFDDETRAQNRRVVVRQERAVAGGEAAGLPELALAAGATINDYTVPFGDADFDVLVPRPVDGLLVIDVRRASGARAIKAVRVEEAPDALDPQAPVIPVSLNLDGAVVDVAGTQTALALDGIAVTLPQELYTLGAGELAQPAIFGFSVPQGAPSRGWIFEVRSLVTDEVVYRVADDGELLTRLGWSGATQSGSPLISGVYEARLTVLGPGAARGISAPLYFAVVDEGESAPELPSARVAEEVRVNGRRVGPGKLVGAGTVYEFEVSGFSDEAFLVDLRRASGSRVVEAIRIPAGFARAGSPPAAPATDAIPDPDGAATGAPVPGVLDSTVPDPDAATGGDAAGDDDAGDAGDAGDDSDAGGAGGDADTTTPLEVTPGAMPRSRSPIRAVAMDALELPDADGYRPMRGHRLGVDPSRGSARFQLVLAQTVDDVADDEGTGTGTDDPARRKADVDSIADDEGGASADSPRTGPPQDVDSVTEPGTQVLGAEADLETFGARELESALAAEGLVDLEALRAQAGAANLKVALPPEDMVLQRNDLVVAGVTDPANTVTVNGKDASVGADGRFHTVVTLPDGKSTLVVESVDADGNRGRIEWPVEVAEVQYFLMAFADTAVSSNNFSLDGANDHNSYDTGDVMLYGQGRLYFKGRVKGSALGSDFFEAYTATAHLDTGKKAEFEEMFSVLIQPDEYYPVYGDSAEEVHEVDARGKLYLLVEADETYLKFANFQADVHGIQHFDYARALYGLDAAFDKQLAEQFDTKVRAFVAGDSFLGDGAERLRHTYNYLRGTGGSLYYLEHEQVLEGSEQVFLVVKDKVTGTVLARVPQTRNVDYVIRYEEGRIIFKSPVSSVADAAWLTGARINTRDTMEGHPVFIEVGYQYESDEAASSLTWGVQGRETVALGEGWGEVSVGVGFVEEGRDGAVPGSDYQLFGADVAWRPTQQSFIEAEYARSRSFDAMAALSDDGGLSFGGLQRRSGIDDVGNAIYVRGQLELADLLTTDRERVLEVGGFYDRAEAGFYANRNALERGTEKFGSHVLWNVTDAWLVGYRNDFLYSEVDDLGSEDPEALKTIGQNTHRLHGEWRPEDHRVALEYGIAYTDDFFAVDGYDMHTVAAAYEYTGIEGLRLGIGQEAVVVAEDPRLFDTDEVGADRFATSLTASWQILDDLALEATERVRWNGENSTRLGLRSQLTDATTAYIQQRFDNRAGGNGLSTTTVIGGEQRFFADRSGRAFGEYQLEGGMSGRANRAIAGIGKTWDVARGVKFDTAYERTQIFGVGGVGESSRDVISLGAELTRYDFLKAGMRFEFRWDEGDSSAPQSSPCLGNGIVDTPEFCTDLARGGFDRYQVVSLNTLDVKLTEDLTALARYNLAITHNITLDALEQIDQSLSFGFALRPVDWDVVNVLAKYTFLDSQRPLALEDYTADRTQKHVVSLVPVYELPWDFQIVNKVAYKRVISEFSSLLGETDLPTVITDTLLVIFRLNYHLWRMTEELTLDLAGEYRFKEQFDPETWEHGTLFEVSLVVYEYLRVGVGYNFTSFTDNEFADDSEDAHGWFFRVQGSY